MPLQHLSNKALQNMTQEASDGMSPPHRPTTFLLKSMLINGGRIWEKDLMTGKNRSR